MSSPSDRHFTWPDRYAICEDPSHGSGLTYESRLTRLRCRALKRRKQHADGSWYAEHVNRPKRRSSLPFSGAVQARLEREVREALAPVSAKSSRRNASPETRPAWEARAKPSALRGTGDDAAAGPSSSSSSSSSVAAQHAAIGKRAAGFSDKSGDSVDRYDHEIVTCGADDDEWIDAGREYTNAVDEDEWIDAGDEYAQASATASASDGEWADAGREHTRACNDDEGEWVDAGAEYAVACKLR